MGTPFAVQPVDVNKLLTCLQCLLKCADDLRKRISLISSLSFVRPSSMYGTARCKLEGKLHVVMRAHAMRVILLMFCPASTRKFKNTHGYNFV